MLLNPSSFSDLAAGIDPAILAKHLNAAFVEDEAARQRERMNDHPPAPSIHDYLDAGCFDAAVRYASREHFCDRNGRDAPMVRADCYDEINSCQEPYYGSYGGAKRHFSHAERPVFMRGSYRVRMAGNSKSLHYAMLEGRFLRYKKVTVLDRNDLNVFNEVRALFVRRYNLSYHFGNWSESSYCYHRFNSGEVFLNGHWRLFTKSELENIKRLYGIIQKTHKLDQRLALARKTKRY
jgi:hypothetical protein